MLLASPLAFAQGQTQSAKPNKSRQDRAGDPADRHPKSRQEPQQGFQEQRRTGEGVEAMSGARALRG